MLQGWVWTRQGRPAGKKLKQVFYVALLRISSFPGKQFFFFPKEDFFILINFSSGYAIFFGIFIDF